MLFSCFGGRIEKPDVLIWPLRVWNLLYKGVKVDEIERVQKTGLEPSDF